MQPRPTFREFLVSTEVGGGNRIALRIADYLQGRGQRTQVWVPGAGPAEDESRRMGLDTRAYDLDVACGRSAARSWWGNWKLRRALACSGPGLVHIHTPHVYGAFHRGLRRTGLKRVVHVQIELGHEELRWSFQTPPELIITCARFLVDQVRPTLPPAHRERQRIVAVPNSVDTDRFRPGDRGQAKARLGAPPHPLIVMLANLAPHKGQETAIRAVSLLRRRGVRVECWLAGPERDKSGRHTARLEALIRELEVGDRVRLLGPRSDAPDLLRAADLFLLPSTNEGLPLSILEAQATRVPVLAAPTAGVPEVIRDGETGLLIAADDAAGYADGIERLLRDADYSRRIADAAFATAVRDYNHRAFCRRVAELYGEVLRQPLNLDERDGRDAAGDVAVRPGHAGERTHGADGLSCGVAASSAAR